MINSRNLRRVALESKRTVSRKAAAKAASNPASALGSLAPSPAVSHVGSKVGSRAPSHVGSDDDGYESDETNFSAAPSVADLIHDMEIVGVTESETATVLAEKVSEILDSKRNPAVHDLALRTYSYILAQEFLPEEISGREKELVLAFLKFIKAEQSEKMVLAAIKALVLTIITNPDEGLYHAVAPKLRTTIQDAKNLHIKAAAINALAMTAFIEGEGEEELVEVLAYLLEIVRTDGESVDAEDQPEPVIAALQSWGLLATEVHDWDEETSQEAIEVFLDQLDSSDADVKIGAGENIALLYETSYSAPEADEEIDANDEDADIIRDNSGRAILLRRYEPFRNKPALIEQIEELASSRTRFTSGGKGSRRTLHTSFGYILSSLQNPAHGPGYSSALRNAETQEAFGSRLRVKINTAGYMVIDKWWKLMRLSALKRALGAGFAVHYENNNAVGSALPVLMKNREYKKSRK